jgi:hypothetical protein
MGDPSRCAPDQVTPSATTGRLTNQYRHIVLHPSIGRVRRVEGRGRCIGYLTKHLGDCRQAATGDQAFAAAALPLCRFA